MLTRVESLRYVGRFSLAFATAVFLLGRYYANPGLYSIALGIAIIGALCTIESRRAGQLNAVARPVRSSRPLPRPSGAYD